MSHNRCKSLSISLLQREKCLPVTTWKMCVVICKRGKGLRLPAIVIIAIVLLLLGLRLVPHPSLRDLAPYSAACVMGRAAMTCAPAATALTMLW